jgi:hypothetical protein
VSPLALLQDLQATAPTDALAVQEIATRALLAISPSGALSDLAARAEARLAFDRAADAFNQDELVLRHLDDETLVSRLEDDFARCVPALADAAVPLEQWAIPLLASLVGPPWSGVLSFGLLLACKVALAALKSWSEKRAANARAIANLSKPSTQPPAAG